MGYRLNEKPKHQQRRDVVDTASPSTVFVQNGTRFHYAIPCWYIVVEPPRKAHPHSRIHHDHVGWPSPNHPDHICQSWDFAHSCCSFDRHKHKCDHCAHYLNSDKLIPIHLTREGYKNIEIAFDTPPEGLVATGKIDEKKDWIIRVTIEANVAKAIKDKVEVPYTIFAEGNIYGDQCRDVVSRGKIVIIPGPYE